MVYQRAETIPDQLQILGWDGKACTWKSFLEDVGWCVHSTMASERRYVVARVRPQMIGEAKALVSRWKASNFDREIGPALFTQELARIKLVRRPIEDANVMSNRYLEFDRRVHEPIASVML